MIYVLDPLYFFYLSLYRIVTTNWNKADLDFIIKIKNAKLV